VIEKITTETVSLFGLKKSLMVLWFSKMPNRETRESISNPSSATDLFCSVISLLVSSEW